MMKELTVQARIDNVAPVTEFIDAELEAVNCSQGLRIQINVAVDGERATTIRHKPENSTLRVDRTRSGFPHDIVNTRDFPVTAGDELKLRLIMDRYSLELFVNDGEQAASFVLYTPITADSISFSCDGTAVIDVEKYELIV